MTCYYHIMYIYTHLHCHSSLHNSNHLPFGYIHNGSWLSTAQVQKCTISKDPQNCFGCCYDYPPNDCKDPACVTNHNDVVIRCGKYSTGGIIY